MWTNSLLAIVLMLLLIQDVAAKKRKKSNQPQKGKGHIAIKSQLMDNDVHESEEGENGHSRTNDKMSPSERAEKLKILTQEGKPGWLKLARKEAKATMEKMKKEKSQKDGGQNKHFHVHGNYTANKKVQHDPTAPSALLTDVESKLSGFDGPLATRLRTQVTRLNTRWSSMSDDDRTKVAGMLGVVATNLEKFGNAGSDPLGAVQGAINIVGAISTFFGPAGQLVSIGMGFVSALLGLFGKGSEPKSVGQIVREQIDEALVEFRDETITAEAEGLITAFSGSKSYLDGAAVSGEPLSETEMILASTRVPMTQGAAFMGELATVIERLFSENRASDAKKCIKYCELYIQLAALKDMILTQMISMSSPAVQNDINGLMGYKEAFREAIRLLLEPLYTTDFGQKIMPYFDPDLSIVTDSYAAAVLSLGNYDRSLAGYYCLEGPSSSGMADLVWSTNEDLILGEPFTHYGGKSNNNCYWKLVPHGNHIFSIVNKKDCDSNDRRCGWMLSWDSADNDRGYVNIDSSNPILWEINGLHWRRIRSKWGCDSGHAMCNKELRVLNRRFRYPEGDWPPSIRFPVGQIDSSVGHYWKLRLRTD